IRAIAADANIDPSMVMRYFGSKDQLFAAAAEFDLRLPELAVAEGNRTGEDLVRHFLDRWEGDETLVLLLRTSTTNTEAAQRMQQIFATQLAPTVARLAPSAPGKRAALVATQILGLALCRYVLKLPPIAHMPREDVV